MPWPEPGKPWGKPLGKKKRERTTERRVPQRREPAKRPNYRIIREQFLKALGQMKRGDRQKITDGTLPEMMVAWALIKNGYMFESQQREGGGPLRLGGGVVDFLVQLGATIVVIRVQGDYWHSLPERKRKDELQLQLLRMKKYRVADLWENDIYRAWNDGRLITFVDDEVRGAQ